MYRTNYLCLTSLFAVVALLACTPSPVKKAAKISNGTMQCEQYLGEYSLQHASVEIMPYENHSYVVFTDYSGQLDTFSISFRKKRRQIQLHNVYNNQQPRDTTCYCYEGQFFNCFLESKTSGLKFRLDVGAKPLCLAEQYPCTDPTSKISVDMLNIFFTDARVAPRYGYLIFHKILGQNSISSHYGSLERYPTLTVFKREFLEVDKAVLEKKKMDPEAPEAQLYYSVREGIVAFSINGKAVWRLVSIL